MNSIDYSQKANWHRIPEITKAVDTFYIYATNYFLSSIEEGAPAYAPPRQCRDAAACAGRVRW